MTRSRGTIDPEKLEATDVARTMTREAGFTRCCTHDLEDPMKAYCEVRP